MKKAYRKALFWIFFVLFVFTTPLVVLYSQGYRFDAYKKIFVHSGSITVKSTPSGINVFIDGKQQKTGSLDIINNSITVNGLRPGNYNLRLTADGYNSWEKNIEVHSGVSTEFWNVFLVPQNISPDEIKTQSVKRYFASPSSNKLVYVSEYGKGSDIRLYDLGKDENIQLFSDENIPFSDDELENAEWNNKEKLILNPVFRNGKKDFLILDSEQKADPFFLSQIAPSYNMDKARWSPQKEGDVYFSSGLSEGNLRNLYLADLDSKNITLISEKIIAFDISSNHIYFLKENNVLYKTDLAGSGEQQVTSSSFPIPDKGGSDCRMIVYDDDRQAIITGEENLIVHNNGKENFLRVIAEGAKGIQFSDDGKKLLFWSGNEISVMFLRDWDVQPRRQENEIQQIVRFSSPIANVFWYRDYEHVFFANTGKVKIIDLDSRDHRICSDVLDYNSEKFLSSYDSINGIFFYVNEKDNQRNIFHFAIPEKQGFFSR